MDFIYIIIVFVVYLIVLLGVNYYINLFSEKEEYTKEELKNILPYFSILMEKINSKHALPQVLLAFILSSFIAGLIPFVGSHWFIQSAILFGIILFFLPIVKSYFENQKVTSSDRISDSFINVFTGVSEIIILGFGLGYASSFMFVWVTDRELSFMWFMLNLIAFTFLLEYTIQKIIKE